MWLTNKFTEATKALKKIGQDAINKFSRFAFGTTPEEFWAPREDFVVQPQNDIVLTPNPIDDSLFASKKKNAEGKLVREVTDEDIEKWAQRRLHNRRMRERANYVEDQVEIRKFIQEIRTELSQYGRIRSKIPFPSIRTKDSTEYVFSELADIKRQYPHSKFLIGKWRSDSHTDYKGGPLTPTVIEEMRNSFAAMTIDSEVSGSDALTIDILDDIYMPPEEHRVFITEISNPRTRFLRDGAFFCKIHTFGDYIDLSKLQIYNLDQITKMNVIEDINSVNCLVNSLAQLEAPETTLKAASKYVKNGHVSMAALSKFVSNNDHITLKIAVFEQGKAKRQYYYPRVPKTVIEERIQRENSEYYELVLFKSHFMPEITTEYYPANIKEGYALEYKDTRLYKGVRKPFRKPRTIVKPMTTSNIISFLNTERGAQFLEDIPSSVYKLIHYKQPVREETDSDLNIRDCSKLSCAEKNECYQAEKSGEKTNRFEHDLVYVADLETYKDTHHYHNVYQAGIVNFNVDESVSTYENEGSVTAPQQILDHVVDEAELLPKKTKKVKNKKTGKITEKEVLPKALIYFHNQSFDANFILRCPGLYKIDIQKNGTKKYFVKFTYKKVEFILKCSYNISGLGLAAFCGAMKTDLKKSLFPYDVMNADVIRSRTALLSECEDSIRRQKKDVSLFLEQAKNYIVGDFIRIMDYSEDYLKMDVASTKEAITVFRNKCLREPINIDIHSITTAGSLSQRSMVESGAYDEVCSLSGNLREYISRSVFGGRCMPAYSKMFDIYGSVRYLDFVSLYPSAMSILKCPVGEPETLTKQDIADLNNGNTLRQREHFIFEGKTLLTEDEEREARKARLVVTPKMFDVCNYFVTIRLLTEPPKMAFPILVERTADGLNYNSDLIGKELVVNNITLEDYQKFCGAKPMVDYEVIRGVSFSRGTSDAMSDKVIQLFNIRKQMKKVGDTAQAILKLILNTLYGKTIQKMVTRITKIFTDEERLDRAQYHGYNRWVSTEAVNRYDGSDFWIMEKVRDDSEHTHESLEHIGSLILSMSKRLMNEFLDLIPDDKEGDKCAYYSDTDSVLVKDSVVDEVVQKFNQKYGRELIGTSLCQLHDDLPEPVGSCSIEELKQRTSKDLNIPLSEVSDKDAKSHVASTYTKLTCNRAIICGKKTYCQLVRAYKPGTQDYLEYLNAKSKGIPQRCLFYKAEEMYEGTNYSFNEKVLKLYEYLYKGGTHLCEEDGCVVENAIEFDLLSGGNISFIFGSDLSVSMRDQMTRKMYFPDYDCNNKKIERVKKIF